MNVTRGAFEQYFRAHMHKWTDIAVYYARRGDTANMQGALKYAVSLEKAADDSLLCFFLANMWNKDIDPFCEPIQTNSRATPLAHRPAPRPSLLPDDGAGQTEKVDNARV